MRILCRIIIFATLAWALPAGNKLRAAQPGGVRVWQDTLTLPTYEEGMPDPNPPFDQFTTNRFNYPYTVRNNITSRRVDHAWRAVYLENEYLKCSVLPDIGGHLYTCVDKISGKSMFYANPSIKKAAIAYRGAWAAFGVEFNFPVSHNWVSMSPVNFAFAKHDDGSASVTVGNIDRVYGMEWGVELVLRPKSTLLEQRVTLSNRSDVRHRFYWWNNAGVEAWDDSRIVYPMRFAATHGFTEIHPWPVDVDGVDYSILRNHTKGPVSMFTHGSRENFMGVWNPHTNSGTVHFAEYEDAPAKKIWSWGVDADGLDWRKALSDNDSGYVEVQAGLFRNQETYAFLEPRQVIHFSEYWMPVREIGGISRATRAGVACLSRKNNTLMAGFNANQPVPQAVVSISNGEQALFQEKVDLVPARTWTHELPNALPQAKYTIEIRDATGAVLLRQTEGEYDFAPESEIHLGSQPSYHVPVPEKRSYDDWIQLGKEDELNGRNLNALEVYKEALAKFPGAFSAGKAAGRLAAGLLRFDEAKELLEPLHLRDTSDTEISYYLGIAYDGLDDSSHARAAYEQAERLPGFFSAAALRLGELLARRGDMAGAERHLSAALRTNPDDARINEELIAIKNAAKTSPGGVEASRAWSQKSLARFPLSDFLREEAGNPDLNHLADDADRVLNVASEYMRLGLYQKAAIVLSRPYPLAVADQSEPGALAPRDHAMVAYFMGYCREKLGQSGSEEYLKASKLSTAYVFPSTSEEFSVLRAAVRARPADATAHYLLGTLYFSRGLTDSALSEWSQAHNFGPDLPVLSASMGLALLHIKNDPEQALSAFRDGMRSDPTNVAVFTGVDQVLSLLNRPAQERVEALEKYPKLAEAPSGLVFELILNLAEEGDFARAERLFHNRFFPREEGGTNVRQVWIEVELQKIIALANADKCNEALRVAQNLGSEVDGLTFTRDGLKPSLQSARTNYLLGVAYAKCGKPEEAKTKFEAAVTASSPDQIRWAYLAAQKLPDFDKMQWQDRLKSALDEASNRSETSAFPSWWMYSAGLLERELGRVNEADLRFRGALLLPDRMLAYHLTRLAKSEATP
jgi:tetratricopeptide (TPR) repeat protein